MCPSVEARVHAWVSMLGIASQVPAPPHAYVVTVRVCVPVIAQRSLPKSQALHAPCIGLGQSLLVAQPVHVSVVASQCEVPGQGSMRSCCVHAPALQWSAPLQRTPSSQLAALFV
jgi:hypothetical protein